MLQNLNYILNQLIKQIFNQTNTRIGCKHGMQREAHESSLLWL